MKIGTNAMNAVLITIMVLNLFFLAYFVYQLLMQFNSILLVLIIVQIICTIVILYHIIHKNKKKTINYYHQKYHIIIIIVAILLLFVNIFGMIVWKLPRWKQAQTNNETPYQLPPQLTPLTTQTDANLQQQITTQTDANLQQQNDENIPQQIDPNLQQQINENLENMIENLVQYVSTLTISGFKDEFPVIGENIGQFSIAKICQRNLDDERLHIDEAKLQKEKLTFWDFCDTFLNYQLEIPKLKKLVYLDYKVKHKILNRLSYLWLLLAINQYEFITDIAAAFTIKRKIVHKHKEPAVFFYTATDDEFRTFFEHIDDKSNYKTWPKDFSIDIWFDYRKKKSPDNNWNTSASFVTEVNNLKKRLVDYSNLLRQIENKFEIFEQIAVMPNYQNTFYETSLNINKFYSDTRVDQTKTLKSIEETLIIYTYLHSEINENMQIVPDKHIDKFLKKLPSSYNKYNLSRQTNMTFSEFQDYAFKLAKISAFYGGSFNIENNKISNKIINDYEPIINMSYKFIE